MTRHEGDGGEGRRVEPVDELVERLERARRHAGGGVLAFDGDGTLWSGDVGVDLFEAALREGALRDEAGPALAEEATRFGVRPSRSPCASAGALFHAFLEGRYPERRACEMMAWCFAGFRPDELSAFAERNVSGSPERANAALEPVLRWATDQGVSFYVVSASPEAAVARAARWLARPPDLVLAMRPAVADGRFAPAITPPSTFGRGKVDALRAAAAGRPVLAAFGDSDFDIPMLEVAEIAVAVRARPSLRTEAARVPGLLWLD